MKITRDDRKPLLPIIGVLLGVLFAVFVPPYFEMRAFNKFTETKATYWDALFTELRVIPDTKP